MVLELEEEEILTPEKLKQFLDERPSVSREGVAREAGLSGKLLQLILQGERTLTDETIDKLLPVLKKYGF